VAAPEPILTDDDRACWDAWMRAVREYAATVAHRRRVEKARAFIADALTVSTSWCCMVSGGKDSTALAALVAEVAPGTPVASEKDDMDYPGEEEYVRDLCARLDLPLTILRPPISPKEVIAREAAKVGITGDWHGRAAELSKICFYDLVEAHGEGYEGIFLGLRGEESNGRRLNRASHGVLYRKRPSKHHAAGQWVCAPLSDWRGIDVYAFCDARGVELLPVYRCIGLLHREEPWRVRKSWWLPNGTSARYGDVAWLRRYYPSLYRQLRAWMPDASLLV
jgi:3'-phosphoadenosine 5'-phosphosulfate sulfotransferase (PAPS reductase)/FAD synthetase